MHERHRKLEELSLNAWPALQTAAYDGWLLRFAEGYTKRSNCVVPLYEHYDQLPDKISYCEQLYTGEQLDSVFKITPFAPSQLDQMLEERGYALVDPVFMKAMELTALKEPAADLDYRFEARISDNWLNEYSAMSGLPSNQREIAKQLMSCTPLDKSFLTLYKDGQAVSCGIGVMEQGYVGLYDIVTDQRYRGLGFGEQLILHLLQWGRQKGAAKGYLLVVQNNEPAIRLYNKIGFVNEYEYWYRVKKRHSFNV